MNLNICNKDKSDDKKVNVEDSQKKIVDFDKHPELLLKHPLQSCWILWYLEQDRNKPWTDMQHEVTSFDTAEEFWSVHNHIKLASDLKLGSDYSIFKKGIRPMWEDDANQKGGRWVIVLNHVNRSEVDHLWLEILLLLIGESLKYADDISGAVVNIRRQANKVSVWTSDGWNKEKCLSIGRQIKSFTKVNIKQMSYHLHKDTIVLGAAAIKPLYTLSDLPQNSS